MRRGRPAGQLASLGVGSTQRMHRYVGTVGRIVQFDGMKATQRRHMTRTKIGLDAVRKMALALPGVEEGTAYGSPAFKIDGKMFACLAVHRSAEPNTLVVLTDFDQRDALVNEEPNVYYLTDHYVDYPCVLVRLAQVREDALRDLLSMGWRFVSTAKRQGARKRKRST